MKKILLTFLVLMVVAVSGCSSMLHSRETVDPVTGETHRLYEVNPAIANALGITKDLNSMNPTPSAPVINLVLGGVSLLLAAYAKRKNDEAKLVKPLIEGVEEGGSQETKDAIRATAVRSGLEDRLYRQVKKITR